MEPPTTIVSPDTRRRDRIPPGQRLVTDFPVLHHGSVPRIDPEQWSFFIRGMADPERSLSYREFRALPMVRVRSDIHCVTTWSRLDNLWQGVPTAAIKGLTAIQAGARFVLVHGAGGFTTNLAVEDFFAEDALFAMEHDGRPVSPEHGAPVRLVVPRLYFWKSAKWVTGVEFMAEEELGFWEQNGYHRRGDPWREERYAG